GLADPLVDEARRDVGGHELRTREVAGDRPANGTATFGTLAGRAATRPLERGRVGPDRLEHGVERVGDPELLERPAREERRDARVFVGRGDEQVAHAVQGSALEIVQYAHEMHGIRCESRGCDRGRVDLVAVAALYGARELPHVERRGARGSGGHAGGGPSCGRTRAEGAPRMTVS